MEIVFSHAKLRGRIRERLGSEKKLCELIGISQNTITHKLSGKRQFTQSEIKQIITVLDISLNEMDEYFFCINSSEIQNI